MSQRGTINGEPYEVPDGWRVVSKQELHRAQAALRVLSDLSRSEHGRHEGDSEFQTEGGRSLGNSFLQTGQRIGTTMDGRPITVPSPRERGNPEAWSDAYNARQA
jgi:hypothetical protein